MKTQMSLRIQILLILIRNKIRNRVSNPNQNLAMNAINSWRQLRRKQLKKKLRKKKRRKRIRKKRKERGNWKGSHKSWGKSGSLWICLNNNIYQIQKTLQLTLKNQILTSTWLLSLRCWIRSRMFLMNKKNSSLSKNMNVRWLLIVMKRKQKNKNHWVSKF